MILEKIRVRNFRVFNGTHEFDLEPRTKYGKRRPIILFGGLNGAGKTTILTAARLALYGKQSIGKAVTQKAYEDYLEKAIHHSDSNIIPNDSASVELRFSYAHMGILKHYTVIRKWTSRKNKIIEDLQLVEDNVLRSEMNADQCQGFLNELVPIGVSDLFFFDGEKIAELAEETGGSALGDSIKKLIGLDVIETLNADLGILIRNEGKNDASATLQKEIESLESELAKAEQAANAALEKYERARIQTSEHSTKLERLENELSSKGGAWAATREQELKKQADLAALRESLQGKLREYLGDSFPLSISAKLAKSTIKQIRMDSKFRRAELTAVLVNDKLERLQKKLTKLLDETSLTKTLEAIDKEFSKVIAPQAKKTCVHDLSESAAARIETVLADALGRQRDIAKEIAAELEEVESELDRAGTNISRAPEQSAIKPVLDAIAKEHEKQATSITKEKQFLAEHKRFLREAIDIARKLEKIASKMDSNTKASRTLQYANSARALLDDFSRALTARKVADLETEFALSYEKLARKSDLQIAARIDSTDFSVNLIGANGKVIDKNDLSAGEKQIYAIAILEALARTSGRRLPVIIDTPLGRLDSKHRDKLVGSYFPNASHQVIVLSTDTEVDSRYYDELSPHISHAFNLEYNQAMRSTAAKEGYFWRTRELEIA